MTPAPVVSQMSSLAAVCRTLPLIAAQHCRLGRTARHAQHSVQITTFSTYSSGEPLPLLLVFIVVYFLSRNGHDHFQSQLLYCATAKFRVCVQPLNDRRPFLTSCISDSLHGCYSSYLPHLSDPIFETGHSWRRSTLFMVALIVARSSRVRGRWLSCPC